MKSRAIERLIVGVCTFFVGAAVLLCLRLTGAPSPLVALTYARARRVSAPLMDGGPRDMTAFMQKIEREMREVDGGPFFIADDAQPAGDRTPDSPMVLRDFLIGTHEVTYEEIDLFAAATGRALAGDRGWGRGRRPAMYMSWYDALEYCNWLSALGGRRPCYTIDATRGDPLNANVFDELKWTVSWDRSADGYRLPTEAEWEYAAGGGKPDPDLPYPGARDPGPVAWFFDNSGGTTHEVGQKLPNELGLYDMAGNVLEWVWDWYGPYEGGFDPSGPAAGQARVVRGGSYFYDGKGCTMLFRKTANPDIRLTWIGFRIARSSEEAKRW